MMYHPNGSLGCDMTADCEAEVSMIDDDGYAYCERHGLARRTWKRCRKLRQHELNRLRQGQQITSY